MKVIQSDERGMITVEATLSLVMFVAAVACIISLINIYTLHNRIQYAITQTAQQYSSYMYIYDGLGLKDIVDQFDADSDKATDKMNTAAQDISNTANSAKDFISSLSDVVEAFGAIGAYADDTKNVINSSDLSGESVQNLIDQLKAVKTPVENVKKSAENSEDKFKITADDFKTSVSSTSSFVESICDNPYSLVLTLFYLATDELEDYVKGTISENLTYGLTQQYLMGDSADEYLIAHSVVGGYEGLNFKGTNIFEPIKSKNTEKKYVSDSDRSLNVLQIDIIVSYDVKLDFPLVPLKDNTITVVQRATTAAWTGHKNS